MKKMLESEAWETYALKKSFKIMKIFLLVMVLSIGQLLAVESYSQETKLTLDFNESKLLQVLDEIENQSTYYFLFNEKLIDVDRKVNIRVKDQSIQDILKNLFASTNVDYKVVDRTIILSPRNLVELQNNLNVKGSVTDMNRQPLPGVTVVVKGTTIGTITDADGNYSLNNVPPNATLMFSFVGMKPQDVALNGRNVINVRLEEETIGLDEVVAIGYGTQKQKDLTGASSSAKAEDFNLGPQLSPQQLIQGKMAGVNISQNSGKPGGSNTVRVRGGTSITASNEPLYVIDGMPISTSSASRQVNIGTSDTGIFDEEPVNPLNSINPSDIASITVLKDASATAIYGSRGANGVIIITTKSGSAGGMRTNYSVRTGVSSISKQLDVLNASEYLKVSNDQGLNPTDAGYDTNWQDEIFRNAFSQDHNLSLSGGNEKSQYRASVGYSTQDGIVIGSHQKSATGRINVNHEAFDGKLKFDFRISGAQLSASSAPISNTVGGESGTNMLYDAYVFNPTYPVYDENGGFAQYGQYTVNPVSYAYDIDDERITRRFLGNLAATYQIVEPLSFKINLGHTYEDINRNSYIHKSSPLGGGLGGYANTQSTVDYSDLLEAIFTFNKQFGSHSINAIAGYSWQNFVDEGNRIRATGFISDAFQWNSIQAASNIESVTTYKESNTLISFYGRVNYNFADRFLVTATVRRDGSSRFGSGNKWGTFPSGSVAWRISNENFFPKNLITDLKIRTSYGVTGNQEIGNYNAITTLGASSTGYLFGNTRTTVVLPEQYANPDLQWEQTAQLDIGVDFELLNGKFYGRMDYYDKTTSDLLLEFNVPSPSVVSTQLANVGSVQNKGFELELTSRVFQRGDFTWKNEINFATNKNKVKSLSNSTWSTDQIIYANVPGAGLTGVFAQRIMPGYPLGTFYGYKFLGIQDGVEQFSDEQMVIGNAQPDFTFGFFNTFMYKNWDFQIRFRGTVGNDIANVTALNLSYKGTLPGKNILKSAMDDGLDRLQPKRWSSRWIENGSFVRLDNLTLGYTFNLAGNKFIKNARVYANVDNLFVITNYKGQDPEVNSDVSGEGDTPLGMDYLGYPKSRTFSVGANITF